MSDNTVECTYKHCRCENKEITLGEEIRIGKIIYHKKCADEWNNVKEIKKLYYENVSQTVVQSVLGKVINDIIYGKCIDADFLLYALKFAINNHYKINTPYGLHYIIDDYKIKNQWNKDKTKNVIEQNKKIEIIETEDLPFYFNPSKQKDFTNIIKE